jgi:hypothetical protein
MSGLWRRVLICASTQATVPGREALLFAWCWDDEYDCLGRDWEREERLAHLL